MCPEYGWVTGYTSKGHPYQYFRRRPTRIDPLLLDSVFYLYPSEKAARGGYKVGGTGFFVSQPSDDLDGPESLYAVTNDHVRVRSPVIRLNTAEGVIDVIPGTKDCWIPHSDIDKRADVDLAVRPLGLSFEHHRFSGIPRSRFITREDEPETHWHSVGPGDEAFMVGRHVNHEGRERNTPMVRFGNLAMMPTAIAVRGDRTAQESFLVEMRSRTGFSGSPVLIRGLPYGSPVGVMPGDFWRFLGVDWGMAPAYLLPVLGADKKEPKSERDKRYVEAASAISAVIPAWKLAELLDSKEVSDMRKEREKQHRDETEDGFIPTDAADPESEFDRFENLTQKLVNTPKKEVDEKRKEDS